ncbi:Uncharacterised protein [Burkholderia pseudomallei]|nr:Uncharacterised protein [Burkholderia pseudomallei]CAJ8199186.1 Uncharacterised protein [Burkholderia pseudomallei]CAJ9325108.1 Uncharacterised protein [Burkholderia pseudomallei]
MAREHAHDVVERCGADVHVDAVRAQRVHHRADLLVDADAVEVRRGDDARLARQRARAFVGHLAQRVAEVRDVAVERHRLQLVARHARVPVHDPLVADLDRIRVADRVVHEVQLRAEIPELLAAVDFVERLVAREAAIVRMQPPVVGVDVGRDVLHPHGLAVDARIAELRVERAVGHALAQDRRELLGREPVMQPVDLVHQQRFFAVVHDARVVPVEHRVRAVLGAVARARRAVPGEHRAQPRDVVRRPAPGRERQRGRGRGGRVDCGARRGPCGGRERGRGARNRAHEVSTSCFHRVLRGGFARRGRAGRVPPADPPAEAGAAQHRCP